MHEIRQYEDNGGKSSTRDSPAVIGHVRVAVADCTDETLSAWCVSNLLCEDKHAAYVYADLWDRAGPHLHILCAPAGLRNQFVFPPNDDEAGTFVSASIPSPRTIYEAMPQKKPLSS